MSKYPKVLIKSDYGKFITIVLDEYFQEDGIIESIIKLDSIKTIAIFNDNIKNEKLDNFFNELKVKDILYLNYNNQNIEFSLFKQ
jgi:hypothetical protein